MEITTRVIKEGATHLVLQQPRQPRREIINAVTPPFSLGLWWKVRQPSTGGHGEKSTLYFRAKIDFKLLGERERLPGSIVFTGGRVLNAFRTKRGSLQREWPELDFHLYSSRRGPLRCSHFCGSPSSSRPPLWSRAPLLVSSRPMSHSSSSTPQPRSL